MKSFKNDSLIPYHLHIVQEDPLALAKKKFYHLFLRQTLRHFCSYHFFLNPFWKVLQMGVLYFHMEFSTMISLFWNGTFCNISALFSHYFRSFCEFRNLDIDFCISIMKQSHFKYRNTNLLIREFLLNNPSSPNLVIILSNKNLTLTSRIYPM